MRDFKDFTLVCLDLMDRLLQALNVALVHLIADVNQSFLLPFEL